MIVKNGTYYWDKIEEREECEKLNRQIRFKAFQNFQALLSIDEVKSVRRHLIAIEKLLFITP